MLVLFISVFPLLMQLYISLTDWSPLSGIGWWNAWELWNSFANYTDLAADSRFWSALWRTAIVMIVCVPAEFLLGLALATLFMDEFPGKRVFYSILLMPMMVVPAVAGYMFFMLFQSGGPGERHAHPAHRLSRSPSPGSPIRRWRCSQSWSPTSGSGRR